MYSLCEYIEPVGLFNRLDFADCLALLTVINDAKVIRNQIDDIRSLYPQWFGIAKQRQPFNQLRQEEVKSFLIEISRLSTIMRDKVFRWAIGAAAGQSYHIVTLVNTLLALAALFMAVFKETNLQSNEQE